VTPAVDGTGDHVHEIPIGVIGVGDEVEVQASGVQASRCD
jgi:hypothetical protein